MTTIDSAARWYTRKTFTLATFTIALGAMLGGCTTSSTSLFSNNGDPNSVSAPSTSTAANSAVQGATSKVAIAPVIGAPDSIGKQIQSQLGSALTQRNIGLSSSPGDGASYTLRGYVVSAQETTGTKISYIWDVTDPTGRRVNRITGEELAPRGDGRNPWQSVTPTVTQSIATKTAGSLAAWLPTQATTAAPPNIAQNAVQPAAAGVQSTTNTAPLTTNTGAPIQNAAVRSDPSSISASKPVSALVPTVIGAPGDGGVSLTNAIQRELSRNGIGMASQSSAAQAYRVEGKVNVGQGNNGKQPIQIDWHVLDPKGKKLGTVSQKNEIPTGSLNGAWGQTANAAAAAAAQGILKLLPKPTSKTAQGTF